MNRRHFFGMTVAAVVAAGLSPLVLPDRTVFLPPRGGWLQKPWQIREVEQYLINNDSLAMRWDIAWITPDGEYAQYYVLEEPISGLQATQLGSEGIRKLRETLREAARVHMIAKIPRGSKAVQLKLPPTVYAAYV